MITIEAHHEAGHVVVALALGIEVTSVTIGLEPLTCVSPSADPVRMAMFLLGGRVYEQILTGLYDGEDEPLASPITRSDGPDAAEAYRFAEAINSPDLRRTISQLMRRTIAILRQNLEPAAAIAHELQRVGTLSSEELRVLWGANGGRVANFA